MKRSDLPAAGIIGALTLFILAAGVSLVSQAGATWLAAAGYVLGGAAALGGVVWVFVVVLGRWLR